MELGQGIRLHDQAEAGSESPGKSGCCQVWVSCHGALQPFLILLVQPAKQGRAQPSMASQQQQVGA